MIQFFRKIRQEYLGQNRFGKYLLYAVGEILLVVIGILIAVAINNRNEQQKLNELATIYRTGLITELQEDITDLKEQMKRLSQKRESIKNYINYYNTDTPKTEVLIQKIDSVNSSKSAFYTNTYTIEDLITTGNLSLFSKQEKKAILKLKNLQQRYFSYESQTIENIAQYDLELKKTTDLLHLNGYSEKQHMNVANWKSDLNSEQFMILNNTMSESLKLYDFQEELYGRLINEIQVLQQKLNQNQ